MLFYIWDFYTPTPVQPKTDSQASIIENREASIDKHPQKSNKSTESIFKQIKRVVSIPSLVTLKGNAFKCPDVPNVTGESAEYYPRNGKLDMEIVVEVGF